MTWLVAAVLALHGAIHVMGFAKAFGYADLPQLTQPISRAAGVAWLLAAVLVFTSAALLAAGSRHTWFVAAVALVVSQAVILSAWQDAWAGTAANAVLLAVALLGWFTEGPRSFQAQFDRDAAAGLARTTAARPVADADLAPLPEPVQRYLRLTGVVGQPRVQNYRLRFRGRIRSAPDSAWMPFEAEQQSFADQPTRLFHMRARMFGLPVDVLHRLIDGHATMQVKLFGAIPIADARGEQMDRAETVTLFNDMCLLAPGTLLGPGITWQPVDARSARAQFTNAGQTISAELQFDADGRLINFVSDDRSQASADGKAFIPRRFSTPLRDYRAFGPLTLASHGEGRWLLPEGEFVYGEFNLLELVVNAR
ncbi:MAG: DUF6544 family protein [Vicinamibacterales bacterium]